MSRVIAIEGPIAEDAHVSWAAAAIVDSTGSIRNSVTGPTTSEDTENLESRGLLTRLEKPFPVPAEWKDAPLIIVVVSVGSPFYDVLRVDTGRLGGVKAKKAQNYHYYLCRSRDAFALYAKEVIQGILGQCLAHHSFDTVSLEPVRIGLSLDPSHPYLNVLRALIQGGQEPRIRLAKANTRGARGQKAFDELHNALTSGDKRYELTYNQGVAAGGGFDIDAGWKILRHLKEVHPKLQKQIVEDFPFLHKSPPPRLHEMRPGSAMLSFATDIEGRTLGERVGRYLELRLLERSLSGDVPGDLSRDFSFCTSLEGIIRPDSSTFLKHKSLESESSEPVSQDEVPIEEVKRSQLVLLGIQTGIIKDTARAEIRLFPGPRGVVLVSTQQDFEGKIPRGAELLTSKESLFRVFVYKLTRVTDNRGRERFYMEEARPLEKSPQRIDALPSSVVQGAFCVVQPIEISTAGNELRIDKHKLSRPSAENQKASMNWLQKYANICYEIELDQRRQQRWLPPARSLRPGSLDRVLVSLDALGGKIDVSRLVEEISRRFDLQVRVNNTRREVILHPKLLQLVGESKKHMELSQLGRRHLAAYKEAEGNTGLHPSQSK